MLLQKDTPERKRLEQTHREERAPVSFLVPAPCCEGDTLKRTRKIAAAVAALWAILAIACALAPQTARAAEGDSVALTLGSDKDAYASDDEAVFDLTLQNNGIQELQAAEYAFELPGGVELVDGQTLTGVWGTVAPGAEATARVRVRLSADSGQGTGEDHQDPADPEDKPDDTVKPGAEDPSNTTDGDGADDGIAPDFVLPAAGDMALGVVLVLTAAGILALAAGKRSRGAYIALLLACGITGAAVALPAAPAYAAQEGELSTQTRTVTRMVTVDGKSVTISATVRYAATGGDQPTDPTNPDEPVSGGDGNAEVSIEYQPDVWVFDDYEVTDEGYVVSEDEMHSVANEMEARGEEVQQSSLPTRARAALAGEKETDSIYQGATCAFIGSDEDAEGGAGTVTEVVWRTNELHKPEALIRIEQEKDPRKVFQSLSVVDPFRPIDISSASFIEGVEPTEDPGGLDKINLKIKKKLSTGDTFEGTFTLDPKLDVDVKWTLLSGFERFKFLLGFDGTATGSFNVTGVDEDIPLLSEPFVVQISHGVNVAFDIKLHLQADGSASIGVELHNVMGVGYIDGEFRSLDENDDDQIGQSWDLVDPKVDCTLRLGVHPYATLRMLKIDIVDLEFGVGGDASGSYVVRPTDMTCCSVNAYIYAEFSVGKNTYWMKEVGLSGGPWVIWDEHSSPIPIHGHFENGKLVDECTYDDMDVPGEDDVTPAEDFNYSDAGDWVSIYAYIGDDTDVVIPAKINGKPVYKACLGVEQYEDVSANDVVSVSLEEGSQLEEFVFTDGDLFSVETDYYSLDSVDFSASDSLSYCSLGGRLIDLKLGGTKNLETIYARIRTDEIYLADYPSLQVLSISGSTIKRIDTTNSSPLLWNLDCSGTEITELDLSGCPQLDVLTCNDTALTTLDVSMCTNLQVLGCANCKLTSLDISKCPYLYSLYCDNNEISELIIGAKEEPENTAWSISCANNNLTHLDLSGAEALWSLTCSGNNISSLDLSNRAALGSLYCSDNNMKELDVSGCSGLYTLVCENNRLTELDLTGCTALEDLTCFNNELTALDISPCPRLEWLDCQGNPIIDASELEEWMRNGGKGTLP